jgi:hypothetical protein
VHFFLPLFKGSKRGSTRVFSLWVQDLEEDSPQQCLRVTEVASKSIFPETECWHHRNVQRTSQIGIHPCCACRIPMKTGKKVLNLGRRAMTLDWPRENGEIILWRSNFYPNPSLIN